MINLSSRFGLGRGRILIHAAPPMRPDWILPLRRFVASSALVFAAALGSACNGCHGTPQPSSPAEASPPTVRLYVLSNLAGALEPCGCTQDQLGGMDRLAAFIASERQKAPASLLIAAGPTAFMDPELDEERATQDKWKAEAISASLGDLGLVAWVPGANDWAAGASALESLVEKSRAKLLAANLSGATAGAVATTLREIAGVKIGIVGVTVPLTNGEAPTDVEIGDAAEAFERGIGELEAQGAKLLVGIAAMPRGEALRLADRIPKLHVLVVGKAEEAGDANDAPALPMLAGKTLVVQTSNHLQTVGIVDFYVRGDDFEFEDASGVANADALASLDQRLAELGARIANWEKDGTVSPSDIAARKADLVKLQAERARLAAPPKPPSGSHLRFRMEEVRQRHGRDPAVFDRMLAFYRRVNEHNKVAFANKQPPPTAPGQSGYVGIEACSSCHAAARKVWDGTAHARAYATLVAQHKEYNLECVGCHVTGYEKPGGSTVTVNASLQNVQCEQCHGPGEAHAKQPGAAGLILRSPTPESCVSGCHHPPHVDGFDPEKARMRILGPGHGMPL